MRCLFWCISIWLNFSSSVYWMTYVKKNWKIATKDYFWLIIIYQGHLFFNQYFWESIFDTLSINQFACGFLYFTRCFFLFDWCRSQDPTHRFPPFQFLPKALLFSTDFHLNFHQLKFSWVISYYFPKNKAFFKIFLE